MKNIEVSFACLLALISFVAVGYVLYRDLSDDWSLSHQQLVGPVLLLLVGVFFSFLAIVRFVLKDRKEKK